MMRIIPRVWTPYSDQALSLGILIGSIKWPYRDRDMMWAFCFFWLPKEN